MISLTYGLVAAVPADATAAWGARLIIDMDGNVDIVPDRMSYDGDDEFSMLLEERFSFAVMKDRIRAGLLAGEFTTRTSEDVVLYEDADVKVVGNPSGSHGYLYVAAWRKPPAVYSRDFPIVLSPEMVARQAEIDRMGA